jgi:hypothetical protein
MTFLGETEVKHFLRYLGDDAPTYEAALLKLFQKYPPPPSGVAFTLHEAGKVGGTYTVHEVLPPGSKTADIAKLVAHKIVAECKSHAGRVFKGVTLDF